MNATDIAIIVTGIGTALSAIAMGITIYTSLKIHKSQQLLSQRQLLLPLWQYISDLDSVDPKNPITNDVIKLVNTLELVALCCEAGIIDDKIIRRTFRDEFMNHFLSIKQCTNIPGMGISGEQLLRQNRATLKFFNELDREHMSQDGITTKP